MYIGYLMTQLHLASTISLSCYPSVLQTLNPKLQAIYVTYNPASPQVSPGV